MAEIDDWTTPPADDWVTPPADTHEPADHGLSERQSRSLLGRAASPVTDYWSHYQNMNREAREQMSRGAGQIANPDSLTDPQAHGIADVMTGAANVGLGGLNFIASPINAAYRSFIGQPLEDTAGIPREYTEFAAQLATPGIGFGKLPKAPGEIAETMPKLRTVDKDYNTPTAVRNRELAEEFDIPLTRGQATEDASALRFEDMAARGAHGEELQKIAKPAFEDQFEAIHNAGQRVGQTLSRSEGPLNSPADAASSIIADVGDQAAAARATRDRAVTAAEREADDISRAADEAIAGRRGQSARSAEEISARLAGEHGPIESPRQAGEIVNEATREAAATNRAEFRGLYDEFGRMQGEIPVDAVRGLGSRIREDLSFTDNPVVIDDHLTPAASRAIQLLDQQSSRPSIQNRASPGALAAPDTQIAGVTIQGVDRMRRHLVGFYKAAQRGSEDARAVRSIIDSFDGQIERAISDGLFSGDPRALEVLQNARASYSRYRREFHPQADDGGVGLAMRRIVERNATPEETANMIIGSGKVGNAGLPVRIADRLENILGADSEAFNAIRQAIWQKASRVTNKAGDLDNLGSAKSILDFADSSLARRMFPDERAAMRTHALGLRDMERAIKATPDATEAAVAARPTARAAEAAEAAYQAKFGTEGLSGPQKQVFQRLVDGTAQPEEVANAMFSIIGSSKAANAGRAIEAVERIVGKDSPIMGNIREGVWQKLIQRPAGKDPAGSQKLAQDINEFLNGSGKDVAKQLYTPEERALMKRYADAVKTTVIGKYARTNSDTAVASGAAAQRNANHIASTLASFLHLGPIGHFGGHYVARKIGEKFGAAAKARSATALRDSVSDVIPKQPFTDGRIPRAPSMFRPAAMPHMRQDQDRS